MKSIKAILAILPRIIFSIDVSAGILIYAIVTFLARQPFNDFILILTVMVSLAPDWDMLPFLLWRKKLKYSSHRRIGHHPLIIIPFFAGLGWLVADWQFMNREYVMFLFSLSATAHFVHDSCHPIGLHWFSPLSWKHYVWVNGLPRPLADEYIDQFFKAKNLKQRSWLEHITSRTEMLNLKTIAFFALAVLLLSIAQFISN
jgi:hypothetical protein